MINVNKTIQKETYFETIKCDDENIYNINYHNKRIANTIGLNIELQEYIYPPSNKFLKCKVTYDKNGIIDVEYSLYKIREFNIFKAINDNKITYRTKSTNRFHIEQLYSKKGIADEIIIIKNGLITDTSIANIAIYKDKKWLTPKEPLLYGTTRARLIDEGLIKEADLSIEDLKNADQIALMNAMINFKIVKLPSIIV